MQFCRNPATDAAFRIGRTLNPAFSLPASIVVSVWISRIRLIGQGIALKLASKRVSGLRFWQLGQ
jgi:hypothetical protein